MYKVLGAIVVVGACLSMRMCSINSNYETEKLDIYYNTGTVVATGQCNNYRCAYTLKTSDGEIKSATTDDPVSLGQVMYQMCWTERKLGGQCYVQYSPMKRKD